VKAQPQDTTKPPPKAVLFGARIDGRQRDRQHDDLDELAGLAEAAGVELGGRLVQHLDRPIPATYIGSGKVEELKALAKSVHADLVLADMDLSPAQARNLSKSLGLRVVDRSELIMDIFAGRARTAQSKLQVELAQLKYMLPRLRGQWEHLDRYRGGGVGTRGPGEKQLETDRRLVNKRIRDLEQRLQVYERRTQLNLAGRSEAWKVALAGYTNTGKSTLFNQLTGADVLAANRLFATLDTRTRRWELGGAGDVLISDTVGFVRDLPHHLVASFHATLEEVVEADLVLHVADASDPRLEERIEAVGRTMKEIGAEEVPQLLILNKVDRMGDAMDVQSLVNRHPGALAVSARTCQGLDELADTVRTRLLGSTHLFRLDCPIAQGRTLARVGELAEVVSSDANESCVSLLIRVSDARLARLRAWLDGEGLPLQRA
jgi:GTP-binding protein HflX